MRVAQGNLAGALESYEAGLAIRERLAAADPGNTEWQRDLAMSRVSLARLQSPARSKEAALTIGARLRLRIGLQFAPANFSGSRFRPCRFRLGR